MAFMILEAFPLKRTLRIKEGERRGRKLKH
jgi:hypothetical protein